MKTSKKDKVNLCLSAFMIIAFVVLGYFVSTFALTLERPWTYVVNMLIFVVFGLFLFYATRVGNGKQVFRFSLSSLILVILPSVYIILASFIEAMPLYEQISANSVITYLASVALGYGLPYTFISGYELDTSDCSDEDTEEEVAEENDGEAETAAQESVAAQSDDEAAEESADEAAELPADETVSQPAEQAAEETADL